MNDEEVKKNRTLEFLRNFLDRTAFGSKEGRQAKYDESKKSLFGQPLPEYGVSEFLQMPDRSKAIERQRKEKEKEEKPELGDSFDQDKYFKELRGLQAQQSILRDYELGREANRQFAMMQRTLPLVDLYS